VTIKETGLPLFSTGIRRLVAFQKATLTGVTVKEVNDPRAMSGWDDYLQVGKEMLS
jgi:chromosome partitioning protein